MYLMDQRVYRNKYGGFLGTLADCSPTLNVSDITNSLIGYNTGVWNINDYSQAVRFGNWPVVYDQLIQNFDARNQYSYPEIGSTVYDVRVASGGRNGTLSGSWDSIGRTFGFNGSGQQISLSSASYSTMGQSFSVEATFYRTTTLANTSQVLFNFAGSNTAGGYRFYAYNTSFTWDGGNGQQGASTTISNSTWYHVVGVRSSAGIYLYINGSLVSSNANAGANLSTANPRIGYNSDNSGERWIGSLGEFRVYNKVLSATEIATNFSVRRSVYGI